ncbi:hypothetical protein EVAR_95658_1 [Eumeta japonica]|uniref:Uncharacterized protein n=1 Tax=Eumeta variegata TaxID=151549 RepID=A0A4C1VJX8_EUMVA|nr:hypothetical protein EVAR_95658_1 [Eumeta japonica]
MEVEVENRVDIHEFHRGQKHDHDQILRTRADGAQVRCHSPKSILKASSTIMRRKSATAPVTPVGLRVSMGGGDSLLSNGPPIRLAFVSSTKNIEPAVNNVYPHILPQRARTSTAAPAYGSPKAKTIKLDNIGPCAAAPPRIESGDFRTMLGSAQSSG